MGVSPIEGATQVAAGFGSNQEGTVACIPDKVPWLKATGSVAIVAAVENNKQNRGDKQDLPILTPIAVWYCKRVSLQAITLD